MKLLAMSDLHGMFPHIPPGLTADVAVVAGDVVPATPEYHPSGPDRLRKLVKQATWLTTTFIPWVAALPVDHVVVTWGNHDWVGEFLGGPFGESVQWPSHVHLLVNRGVTLDGVSFWGIPQTPRFFNWAYNEDDTPEALGRRWLEVPEGTDVLVTHGPPKGASDTTNRMRMGSRTQRDWLKSDAKNVPRIVVCGHIHEASGMTDSCGRAIVHNVAICNPAYYPRNPVRVITVGE